ncbi:hypothetical protein G6L00_22925 [Agrobacterium rhizogenes]|nr:hypothetical protein [Rhizobium rhizogenes]NTH40743.1 hypothetical protein [Rhizobium rhizogenes]
MNQMVTFDAPAIRAAMADFEISPSVQPNETIEADRVFFPDGHRGVLDLRRQLVVGNRGMGKSFWTHALTNPAIRERLAHAYSFPAVARTNVVIGFNGSEKLGSVAPTIEEIQAAHSAGHAPEIIWRTVILRAVRSLRASLRAQAFAEVLVELSAKPGLYAHELSSADDELSADDSSFLIVFDALDRLAHDWGMIRALTKGLLATVVGLQSFRGIRAKVFMRVDQFADSELFTFPDSSKIRNDRVDLAWRSHELYGLVFFQLLRSPAARAALQLLAEQLNVPLALPSEGRLHVASLEGQATLVTAIAGEYMGGHRKRGRVYTWVPLHLGDAANNCSPRTFLTAWKTAADHVPAPQHQAVDHLGLIEGVRRASSARLTELREDYRWIDLALEPLRRQFVPISRKDLFDLWEANKVTDQILDQSSGKGFLAPIGMFIEHSPAMLLITMTSIAVMEERANGKINVPDIFRVEAEILRKGGVAVPRRG